MNNFDVKKVKKLFQKIVVFSILFFVPLFFAIILQTNNVFELNKTVIFRILVVLLILVFTIPFPFGFIRVLSFGRGEKGIIFLFLSSLVISTYFSINSNLSFFGFYEKQEGLLSYFYYFAFFVLVSLYIKNTNNDKVQDVNDSNNISTKRILCLIWAMVSSSLFVCGYGLLQMFGLDPLGWAESTQMRVTSTFGQPNNLGSYLIFLIPLTMYFLFKIKNRFLKSFLFLLFLSQILVLYYSFSVSSWLGLFFGLIAWFAISFFWRTRSVVKKENNNKIKRLAFFSGVIMFLFVLIQFNPGILKNKIDNLRQGSTAARLQFWEAAIEGIKEKPFFGHGLETQQDVLMRYYQPDWAVYSNVNVAPPRAHNWGLDILLAQGFVGLIAHLLLWGAVFLNLLRNIKNNHEKSLSLAMLISLISYFIFLQFNYPNVTMQVYFWLFVAVVLGRFFECPSCLVASASDKKGKWYFLKYLGTTVVFLLLLFGSFKIIRYEINKLQADHYLMEMRRAEMNNQYMLVIDMYDFIKESQKSYGVYDGAFVNVMHGFSKKFDNDYFYKIVNKKFINILPEIKSTSFSDFVTRAYANESLGHENEKYFFEAETAYKTLLEKSPKMPLVHRLYADFLFGQKREAEARVEYGKCLENLPSLDSIGLNSEHRASIEREMGLCEYREK